MTVKRMPPAVVAAVEDRADGMCEALIPGVCTGRAEQLHHRQMRSQGGQHTVENGIFLCHACHAWVHAHPKWAYRAELLVHGWDVPSWPPRFYRGRIREEEGNEPGSHAVGDEPGAGPEPQ